MMHVMTVLRLLGLVFLLVVGLLTIGAKLPVIRGRIADWLVSRGVRSLGDLLILVDFEDGVYELAPGRYDHEKDGYWGELPRGEEFYDAEGVSDAPGTFYGVRLVVAYDGLGSVEDFVDGEIGEDVEITLPESPSTSPGPLAGLLNAATERLGIGDRTPVADGGTAEASRSLLPARRILDLRDTLYNAPFHVRPAKFHEVEKNAQKAQTGFAALGPAGQAAIIMGAMALGGLLAWFVMGGPSSL